MKNPTQIDPNRLISVLSKHNEVKINAFIFSKNITIRRGGAGLNISLTRDEQLKC